MAPSDQRLRLGTRGSPLALWQARWVAQALEATGIEAPELVIVKTTAERFPEKSITGLGVGIFTKELDEALLGGEIDLAVHSLKDVPTAVSEDLTLGAVPERESPWDALITTQRIHFTDLPAGAKLGTSSPRRQAQLLAQRPDLEVVPLRGNVETRLRKVEEQGLAGTVLAHAGLRRLEREDLITELFDSATLVPAVAQGALGILIRRADQALAERLAGLEQTPSRQRVTAERAFLSRLRGGCQVPVGALAEHDVSGERLHLTAIVASTDGARAIRGQDEAAVTDAEALGTRLAEKLLAQGADQLLSS